jgi:hypothetical protein
MKYLKDFYAYIIHIGIISWSLIGAIILLALFLGFFPDSYSVEKTFKVITKVENEAPVEMEQHCKCKAIGASK